MFSSGSRGMANNNVDYFELPELITLYEFGGNFNQYLEAVYEIFKADYILNKPVFQGRRLGLKKHPMFQDKEATFWHMTTSGEVENEREPDLRRMERIRWSPKMINESEHPYLKVWRNKRPGKQESILIWHDAEKFLVVLRDHGDYILPWTTYVVDQPNRERRLMKEYQAYIASQNADSAQP